MILFDTKRFTDLVIYQLIFGVIGIVLLVLYLFFISLSFEQLLLLEVIIPLLPVLVYSSLPIVK